jgi:hypothetical protein
MQVVRLGADSAVCIDEHGAEHEVAVDLVAPVAPEQTILVHAGVAIGALS